MTLPVAPDGGSISTVSGIWLVSIADSSGNPGRAAPGNGACYQHARLDPICALCYFYAHIYSKNAVPDKTDNQAERREALRRILKSGPAATQRVLVRQLRSAGLAATQSSVSRDLKDIGAVKTGQGYELAGGSSRDGDEIASVAGLFREMRPAGPHLLVIRTAIGAAQRVALALDRSGWPEIVGNVGGDDTVFAATSGAAAQRKLRAKIERAVSRGLMQQDRIRV